MGFASSPARCRSIASRTEVGWDAKKNPARWMRSCDNENCARTASHLSNETCDEGWAARERGSSPDRRAALKAKPVRTRRLRRSMLGITTCFSTDRKDLFHSTACHEKGARRRATGNELLRSGKFCGIGKIIKHPVGLTRSRGRSSETIQHTLLIRSNDGQRPADQGPGCI